MCGYVIHGVGEREVGLSTYLKELRQFSLRMRNNYEKILSNALFVYDRILLTTDGHIISQELTTFINIMEVKGIDDNFFRTNIAFNHIIINICIRGHSRTTH